MESVTRYVVTKIGKNGMRCLADACQGRFTYATYKEAQTSLDNRLNSPHNSKSTLEMVYGDVSKMEVRSVQCYPGHFDPMSCYFP